MLLTFKHDRWWTHEEPQTNANNAYVCATRYNHYPNADDILFPPSMYPQ